ncbi:nesprin-2-like isoform X1 [Nilaparvata lugens]|uniref:nesprin-2-like isoform X1 n=2 Tax=Nilaparvata lugens TaxID=108931 RepID=UPI00193D2AD9|nr:nesprin-2-like isoform X1 [Nilaparvata lugens]
MGGRDRVAHRRPVAGAGSGGADQVLRRLETELQAEVVLKRREVEWLTEAGSQLAAAESDDSRTDVAGKLDDSRPNVAGKLAAVTDAWERLQQLTNARANKLRHIIQGMSQLELEIEELRGWLHSVEVQLATPIRLDECTKDDFDKKLLQHEELQTNIEKHSRKIGDVLNFFELLLNDCDNCRIALSTEGITSTMKTLEKRWMNVCVLSAEKKRQMLTLWALLQEVLKGCEAQEEWLAKQESCLAQLSRQTEGARFQHLGQLIAEVEAVETEIECRRPALSLLEQSYSRLTTQNFVENLTVNVRSVLQRWYDLASCSSELLIKLNAALQKWREFANAHGRAVLALTQADVRLTEVQYLDSPECSQDEAQRHKMKQIQLLRADLRSHEELMKLADISGEELLETCVSADVPEIQLMMQEYHNLFGDLKTRLEAFEIECEKELKKKQVVSEGVQVETLRFETDSSVQVNTLPVTVLRQDAYLHELRATIRESQDNLDKLQKMQPVAGKSMIRAVKSCQSSVELAKHLCHLLQEQCNLRADDACVTEVDELSNRLDILLSRVQEQERQNQESSNSARLTCPLCSHRNWQQLENDIWRLEQWLQHSEATQSLYPATPPTNIEQLEDTVQDLWEMLLNLDSHKSLVVSLNIVGKHLAEHTEDEVKASELRERLARINHRWDMVCAESSRWQNMLQTALMENEEFHETIMNLVAWLEKTENSIRMTEPVDLAEDRQIIQAKYNKFKDLHRDLERCEPKVMSLQETANHVLRNTGPQDGGQDVCANLTNLRLKLHSLIRLTGVYVLKLGATLGHQPSELVTIVSRNIPLNSLASELLDEAAGGAPRLDLQTATDEVDTTVLTRSYRFLGRVLRASLPIQALMLLLLGVATLVPVSEDDYSCLLRNNFARSLEPMLRYDNGPPPV